jgi:outer membrane protein assembly factor BamA
MLMLRLLYSVVFLCFTTVLLQAQQSSFIQIKKITVVGHKKTLERVILRELDFNVGDSIATNSLQTRFNRNNERLMNTTLYGKVEINVGHWNYDKNEVEIIVKVVESWYIFPFGWVSLADRNFNVWWQEKNRDLRRFNYQIGLNWNNVSGRADRLKASVEVGFGQKYELDYQIPGINKKRTIGFFFNTLYGKNKEIWYKTEDDKLQFYNDPSSFQIERFKISSGISFRPRLRATHRLQLSYFDNEISDYVAKEKNVDFFLNAKKHQQYFSLIYKFTEDNRDNKAYPIRGSFFTFEMEKNGLFSSTEDVQALYFTSLYAKYFKIYQEKINFETVIKARKEMTGQAQPYYNSRALGYREDYLRGFEYNVIDGVDYIYCKNSLRFKLIDIDVDFGDFLPDNIRYLPYKLWFTINNDFGYVKNTNASSDNVLPNRLLWGRGIGFNLLLYRTNYYQFEMSQNYFGKVGFFFHAKTTLE